MAMSGDIEDFLRRAAQRRQSRQGAQTNPPQPAGQKSRAFAPMERAVAAVPLEEEIEPALLAEPLARRLEELKRRNELTNQAEDAQRQGTQQRRQKAQADKARRTQGPKSGGPKSGPNIELVSKSTSPKGASSGPGAPMTQETVAPADAAQISQEIQELLQMMRSPQGLRSAILMREIFDRPEHRW
jgi:hypothetical protein